MSTERNTPGSTGLFHIGVTVSDMDASLRFYRDGLGLEVTSDRVLEGDFGNRLWGMEAGEVRIVFLDVPGSDTVVELLEFGQVEERQPVRSRHCDPGSGHVCIYVDDAEAVRGNVEALGFPDAGEVVTVAEGPRAGTIVTYVFDPDGYPVELFQPAP